MTEPIDAPVTAGQLLAQLQSRNVTIRLEDEQLRIVAPAGVLTPELKQMLTVHKAALQDLLRAEAGVDPGEPAIPVLPRPGPFPLSFAQQRLWFLEQLEPGQPAYHMSNVFRVRGDLHISAMEQALTALVLRHEPLRTVIRSQDGVPYQVVEPPAAITLPIVDLTDLAAEGRLAAALSLAHDALVQPFDLTTDLMLRVRLFRLAADDHLLVACTHHIASDGWSLNIFWREFASLYRGFAGGEVVPLPTLAIQYADFAVWQRQWLRGERLNRQLDYWQRTLSGLTPLALPTDHPRPALLSQQGSSVGFSLDPELTQRLRQLARQEGMTLFMLLAAAFQVLCHRYSGQDDIAIGTAIANRNRLAIEGLVGFFVNTLVLRTDLAGNLSFQALLQRVRTAALDAFDHQDLPFEKLVEELHPERQRSRHPLFQVMVFQVLAGENQTIALPGMQMEPVRIELNNAKFDLALALLDNDDHAGGRFTYSTDLFDAATIARLAGHFQTLLAGVAADPACPIDQLPLLTAAERQQVLVTWNATATNYPRTASLAQLFELQTARRAAAIALTWGSDNLTYGELNLRANRLAHLLRDLGIDRGATVGLCLRRSPEMIVALLAILKAGGAYVPLDATYPPARLAFMVTDAGVGVILTDAALAPHLADTGAQLLLVDAQPAAAGSNAENPPSVATADDLAYVMYTSGSTGQPKGVAVSQRAVARLVCNVDYVTLGPEEVLLHLAPLSFDASTFEIWGALLHGATLVLAPDGLPDYAELEALIVRQRVSIVWLTAGLFNSIIDQRPQMLRSVRQVLTGGQALSVHHVRAALQQLPGTALINGYGPTENTTFTCCYPIPHPLPDDLTSIPIGRPVPNTQVYILDAHLAPTPIGIVGELCTSGDGLAHGYLNQPELTAAQFIDHPFRPGERLYRTGDLARWRSDGVIEFVGRRDRQVKIRGYRVEPGEVETVLHQHAAVRAAAVITQEQGGEERLVAYLVVDPAHPPTIEDLRSAVASKLPEYMAPSAYRMVAAIPLTANGKLDVPALLAQSMQPAVTQRTATAPRDALEQQLVHIWEHVLDVRPVGVDDDFFDLGGHSLLAVKLLDQVGRATGRNLPLTVLLETPTVAALAQALRARAWTPKWSALTPIQAGGELPPLFLVPPAASSPLRFRPLASHLGPAQPVYAFHPSGLDDDQAPHTRVDQMAAYYLAELRRFLPDGPYLLGGMCFGAHVALEMACQLEEAGAPVIGLVVLDADAPLNGPTWQRQRPKRDLHHYLGQVRRFRSQRTLARAIDVFVRVRLNRPVAWLQARVSRSEQRKQRIREAHRAAQCAYRARPLCAPVILIQSEQLWSSAGCRENWSLLATGTRDFHVVPGTSHRDLLMAEPFLGQLATLVSAGIDHITTPNGG